ncbi:tRNA (guanosine(46)-N(7))-methyltransferase TrmB [Uliginosibacterium sp. TH139]|uniref:tRNA (guanine(46)-N(7))-methyltransferase TrmB n=1 Tax=Uliginosibacterium sp. TH139 TaxID=2067453 RepID=UPI000C7DA0F7|nr:methyltransferase domain-containing protein [Uliginosibacterium sp. TH139]PLK47448.1 SAM-dependent methyltransferase [Uliginosibacterium sp. TH139]
MMYANSRDIRSAQIAPHEHLAELVRRHCLHEFQKPVAPWNREAFEQAMTAWGGGRPLLLDAGCGVGWSSLQLARRYPDHFVLGIDQSEDRLARGKPGAGDWPDNLCFVRADLVDFWALLRQSEIRLARHYILYPNPWPKIGHLARRWHGHAIFPTIVELGGVLESRSNWSIYLEELAQALRIVTNREALLDQIDVEEPLTLFERKYRDSGQALYRLSIDLGTE